MIAIDLFKVHYQILLITYLEFMIKNVIDAGKEKNKVNCEFVRFKNGRLNCKCKKCKKSCTKTLNGKNFPTLYKF